MRQLSDLATAKGYITGVIECLKCDIKERDNEMPSSMFKSLDKGYIESLEQAVASIKSFMDREKEEFDERITRTAHPRAFADELVADLCDAK